MYGDPWTRGAAPHTATKLITAPVIEPYALEEAKSHCRIAITDDDARVSEWIRAARTKVEKDTGRALLTQTWDLFLDAFYCGGPYLGDFGWPRYARPAILVPYPPLQSVTSVNQTDTNNNETVWAASNYVVDTASEPGRIGLSDTGSWPTGLRIFQPGRVRFVAGWTSAEGIPDSLRQAVALQIGWFSENREPNKIERDAYEQLIAPFSVFSAV
jgi:uncharacterized phiE125 gp8 family phage protein